MRTQLSTEEVEELFSIASEFDPEPDSWGLFAYSDGPPFGHGSGFGSFGWFETQEEMIRFTRDVLAWWRPYPSYVEAGDFAEDVKIIIDDFDLETGIENLRHGLNAFMRNLWHISWWGQFTELTHGTSRYPTIIRRNFFQSWTAGPPPAIVGNQLPKFKRFLREYGT